jgi:hypothetical protein
VSLCVFVRRFSWPTLPLPQRHHAAPGRRRTPRTKITYPQNAVVHTLAKKKKKQGPGTLLVKQILAFTQIQCKFNGSLLLHEENGPSLTWCAAHRGSSTPARRGPRTTQGAGEAGVEQNTYSTCVLKRRPANRCQQWVMGRGPTVSQSDGHFRRNEPKSLMNKFLGRSCKIALPDPARLTDRTPFFCSRHPN